MTIYLEEEGDLKLPVDTETLAREAAEAALDEIGCPYEAEVNLLLTMNGQIREMNREFRNIDRATDVLSFPMIEYETPGDLISWKTVRTVLIRRPGGFCWATL